MNDERDRRFLSENEPISHSSYSVAFDVTYVLGNLIAFPFRLLWNLVLIGVAVWLEVLWLGFVFGSVVGVILLLIFWIEGFLFPLALLGGLVSLWPKNQRTIS